MFRFLPAHKSVNSSLWAILALVVSGCSTYAHYDYYEPISEASKPTLLPDRFGFYPLRTFASAGPLGIPAIPVSIPASNETLELEVHFERHRNVPFSVSRSPCINLENGQQICAHDYEISGFAENSKLEWPNNRKFISYGPHGTNDRHSRITSNRIYEQNGFIFTSEWNWLALTVNYKFQCGHVCPSTFTLDSSSLLEVNGTSQFNKEVKYVRKTKSNYEPLANFTN